MEITTEFLVQALGTTYAEMLMLRVIVTQLQQELAVAKEQSSPVVRPQDYSITD